MAWGLTEDEAAEVMKAAYDVVQDYWEWVEEDFSYTWENPDGSREQRHSKSGRYVAVAEGSTPAIRRLDDVLHELSQKGLIIGAVNPHE